MINKISKNIIKKHDQIGAIFFSFLAHILLLILLVLPFVKQNPKPNFTILEVSIISANHKSDIEGKLPKKLSQQHKVTAEKIVTPTKFHTHLAEELAEVGGGAKNAVLVHNPLPQIPEELRLEAFQSEATARFYIDIAGNVEKVDLIKSCANPRLNNLLLKALRQWKFSPSRAASTQDIKVRFRVE